MGSGLAKWEFLLVLGLVLAVAVWELRSLRRYKNRKPPDPPG